MDCIVAILSRLEGAAVGRVMSYITSRYGSTPKAPPPHQIHARPSKPKSETAPPKTRTVVQKDDDGTWCSQNELARRIKLSGAGLHQFLARYADRLTDGVHRRELDGRTLYCVEEMRDLREEIGQERADARDAKYRDTPTKLEALLAETE